MKDLRCCKPTTANQLRELYLDESVLPVELVGAAVDRTNIQDPVLQAATENGIAEQLRLLLDEHAIGTLTLDDAAARLQRSKAHLVRSFSARYGVAPHAYLIGKRVEVARGLLLEGVSPAEVASAVGFYDQSHLTRHFKRHTSVTPGAYAASHGGV